MTDDPQTFVSISVTPEARDALRKATLELSLAAGRRVSMSYVLVVALHIAGMHREQLVARLLREQS